MVLRVVVLDLLDLAVLAAALASGWPFLINDLIASDRLTIAVHGDPDWLWVQHHLVPFLVPWNPLRLLVSLQVCWPLSVLGEAVP